MPSWSFNLKLNANIFVLDAKSKTTPNQSENHRKRPSDNMSPPSSNSKCTSISPPVSKHMKFHSPSYTPVQQTTNRQPDFGMSAPNVTVTPQNSLFQDQSPIRGMPGNQHFNPQIPVSLMMQRGLNQLPGGINHSDISSILASAASRAQGFEQTNLASQLQGFLQRPQNPPGHGGLGVGGHQLHQLSPAAAAAAAAFGAPGNANNNVFDPHNSFLMRSAMLQQLYQRVASTNSFVDPRNQVPTSLSHSPNGIQQISPNSIFQNPYLPSHVSQAALNNKLSEFSPTGKIPTSLMESEFLFKSLGIPQKTSPTVANESEMVQKLKEFRS